MLRRDVVRVLLLLGLLPELLPPPLPLLPPDPAAARSLLVALVLVLDAGEYLQACAASTASCEPMREVLWSRPLHLLG